MRKVWLCGLVWAILAVPSLSACDALNLKLRKVTADVTLIVTHRGKPVAGIEVKIFRTKNPVPVFMGITDEQGKTLHKHLAPGQYDVYASHGGFDAPTEWLEVVSQIGPEVARKVQIEWAEGSYLANRVAGTLTGLIPGNTGKPLMDLVHPVSTTYPGVAVELRQAFSGEEYSTLSDSSGAFLFPEVPDGTYILTIAGGMNSVSGTADVTRLIVDVTRSSTTSSFAMFLSNRGCGGTEFHLAEN